MQWWGKFEPIMNSMQFVYRQVNVPDQKHVNVNRLIIISMEDYKYDFRFTSVLLLQNNLQLNVLNVLCF